MTFFHFSKKDTAVQFIQIKTNQKQAFAMHLPIFTDAPAQAGGRIVFFSGPTAVGKFTLINMLRQSFRQSHLTKSWTTRPRRPGDKDTDYHFVSLRQFEELRDADGFLEYAEVHSDFYGTPKDEVLPHLDANKLVFIELDVDGFQRMKALTKNPVSPLHGVPTSSFFIRPPGFTLADQLSVLEQRIRNRGSEDDEAIRHRLARVEKEMARAGLYDHSVVNFHGQPLLVARNMVRTLELVITGQTPSVCAV